MEEEVLQRLHWRQEVKQKPLPAQKRKIFLEMRYENELRKMQIERTSRVPARV